jgi:hypothetical protein
LADVSSETFNGTASAPYRAVTVFIEISALLRLARYLIYAYFLPPFWVSFTLQATAAFCFGAIFMPLAFTTNITLFVALPCFAFAVGFGSVLISAFVAVRMRQPGRGGTKHWIPAVNYEHLIARSTDFTILVLGESVLACARPRAHMVRTAQSPRRSTYKATSSEIGAGGEYARGCLGVCICFSLAWCLHRSLFSITGSI